MSRPPELLAPAGGPDAFLAAIANGADAVYVGLGSLNARRGAENFEPDSLAAMCRHAHLAGARVYLAANTLVLPDEMADAVELVATAWAAGVDAAIVQDLGLMRMLARYLPEVRLHASTQLNAHNTATIEVLASLGCERVTLAREVALTDIQRFCAIPGGPEIEVFAHGSLCYCYSGQCLLSSMVGGRSANRGMCAQPCRLPYELVGRGGVAAEVAGDYLLSPKDLAGIGLLPDLVRAGVTSLKIEGRMKAPEYVALVTGVYRAALDRAVDDPDGFEVTPGETSVLEEAFSRGFTDGYLRGDPGPDMMSYRRPNNRGVPVGRVVGPDTDGDAVVALDKSVCSEDRLEFWTRSGRFAQPVGPMRLDGRTITRAQAGDRPSIRTVKLVRPGDRVFRVADADLLSGARRTFAKGPQREVPMHMAVSIRVGEPLLLKATAGGATVTVTGPEVEAARTKPLTATDAADHLGGRLGGSGYVAGDLDLSLDAKAGLPFSALHHLRREAVEALDVARLAPWASRAIPNVDRDALTPSGRASRPDAQQVDLVVWAADTHAVEDLLTAGASIVMAEGTAGALAADAARTPGADEASSQAPAAAPGSLLPRILSDGELEAAVRRAAGSRIAATGNLGALARLVAAGVPRVEADPGANVTNRWTIEALRELGAAAVWLSPELSERAVRWAGALSPLPTAMLVYGRTELMVAENCVLAALGPCDRRCGSCVRRRTIWALRDRKGYEFPVLTDAHGRSHVFNSVTLDLSRALPQIVEAGITAVGVDVRLLPDGDARRVISAIRERLGRACAGLPVSDKPLVIPATTGHFFRGVE